ncbi:MAG TPA: arabinose transporter permease [Ruminiclostridium sp.]|jgi:arabinosaccharide transport system permease protein|nr:carbohydrate ABC transporter permease [Clostridiaceae bacterium]NLM27484.1 carbohydrate ABC transporter permease [Clostridiaceae bacterium]HAA26296.1 arabinose transporter permease [Ruminiclostridium sp.]
MKKYYVGYRLATTIIFLILSICALGPFVYLLIASFIEDMSQVFKNGLSLKISMDMLSINNYALLFTKDNGLYFSWYKNSLIITIYYTVVSLFFSSLVGYGVTMYDFKFKRPLVVIILSTMMIPLEILMLPLYREMLGFGLLNTYTGVVIPFAVSAFAIYFFMQYAQTLPKELMDAARVDGCGEFRIYYQIMAPIMIPAFGTMAILQAMTAWNDFLWPLIVMSTNRNFTLTVGLQTYLSPYGNNYNALFSGAVLSVIPIMILFLANQKTFISGLTIGGVKG